MSASADPPDETGKPPLHGRRIKSFVIRPGRMGSGQIKALRELAPKHVLPFQQQPPDWDAVFGRKAPRVLEIGFGMGDATAKIAASLPHLDFIACEVHEAGVGSLLQRIEEAQLRNVRILQHDAVEVLQSMIPRSSLHGVHLYFPDPWHKKRHHKRRLVQPGFVSDLVLHIGAGGYFHAATDWQPYAEQMLEVLSAEPGLENTTSGFAEKPSYRPLTKFEARGLRLGHGVWDLVFRRREAPSAPA
jgi:tRNA (guanine-N7-)-methyltransferase